MENFKCQACGKKAYDPQCDWNQGRCPWHEPLLLSTMPEFYFGYLYLGHYIKSAWQRIKSVVKRVLRV